MRIDCSEYCATCARQRIVYLDAHVDVVRLTQCATCHEPMVLSDSRCACPVLHYNTSATQCARCAPTCLTCRGPAFEECSACDPRAHRFLSERGECLCQEGFQNDYSYVCSPLVRYTYRVLRSNFSDIVQFDFSADMDWRGNGSELLDVFQITVLGLPDTQYRRSVR